MVALPFIVRIERAEAFADDLGDRSIRRQRHVLHQPRDPHAGLPQHEARIGLQIAAEDLQQRRLAGAVAADDGDPFTGIDLEGDLVEQRQVAEGEGDTVERNERHGIFKRTRLTGEQAMQQASRQADILRA